MSSHIEKRNLKIPVYSCKKYTKPNKKAKVEMFYHKSSRANQLSDSKPVENMSICNMGFDNGNSYNTLDGSSYFYRAIPFHAFIDPERFSWFNSKKVVVIQTSQTLGPQGHPFSLPPLDYSMLQKFYPLLSQFRFYEDNVYKCDLLFDIENKSTEGSDIQVPVCPRLYYTNEVTMLIKEDLKLVAPVLFNQNFSQYRFHNDQFVELDSMKPMGHEIKWCFFIMDTKFTTEYLKTLTIDLSPSHMSLLRRYEVKELVKFENFPKLRNLTIVNMLTHNDSKINR